MIPFLNLRRTGAWWVEITTMTPHCTYYFGPFYEAREAHKSQNGYIEDPCKEGAQDITVRISQCQPSILTVTQ